MQLQLVRLRIEQFAINLLSNSSLAQQTKLNLENKILRKCFYKIGTKFIYITNYRYPTFQAAGKEEIVGNTTQYILSIGYQLNVN